jgi:hypothetical protein
MDEIADSDKPTLLELENSTLKKRQKGAKSLHLNFGFEVDDRSHSVVARWKEYSPFSRLGKVTISTIVTARGKGFHTGSVLSVDQR